MLSIWATGPTPLCGKFNDFGPFSLTLSLILNRLFLLTVVENLFLVGKCVAFFLSLAFCDLFKVIVTVDIDANEHCNLPSIDWLIFLFVFLARIREAPIMSVCRITWAAQTSIYGLMAEWWSCLCHYNFRYRTKIMTKYIYTLAVRRARRVRRHSPSFAGIAVQPIWLWCADHLFCYAVVFGR